MDLCLYRGDIFRQYKSNSQRVRRLSESWFDEQMYCPACECNNLESYPNNMPVADFFCPGCGEEFQLKSQLNPFGGRILDGAYSTMIDSILHETQPNFFLMRYSVSNWSVVDLEVIPSFFFTDSVIEKRRPLSPTARRSGWVGCNILLSGIPGDGRIPVVRGSYVEESRVVRSRWENVSFLKEKKPTQRGWITDIMWCIRDLDKVEFSLQDVYSYVDHLVKLHPQNRNIKPKIRQQLQFLRDKKYLRFIGGGRYRLINR